MQKIAGPWAVTPKDGPRAESQSQLRAIHAADDARPNQHSLLSLTRKSREPPMRKIATRVIDGGERRKRMIRGTTPRERSAQESSGMGLAYRRH